MTTTWAAALALASPSWPVVRLLAAPGLWRANPRAALRLTAALAGGLVVVVAVLALAPPALAGAAAAAAVAVTAVEIWLGRPARGVSQGMPPGSLGLLPPGPWRSESFFAAQAARYGTVFKSRQLAQPMACLADLPAARRLLAEEDASLVAPPLPFSRFIPGGYLRYRDHGDHRRTKDVFRVAFALDVVAAREQELRAALRGAFADAAAEGPAGVPPRARVNRMLFPAWAGLFAGFEPDAPELPRLRELAKTIDRRGLRFPSDRTVRIAVAELTDHLQAQRARLDALPPGAAPRCFLDEIRRRCPGALDDPAVLGNLVFLFQVSWGDVGGLLTWIARMLTDHPAALAAARADSGPGPAWARDGIAARIVLETLRLHQSEFLYRRATRQLQVGDATIPAGWTIRVCVHEAHRDPAVFDQPDAFDPDRFLGRSFGKDELSPFGAHRLACLGEQVTLAVGSLFTAELSRFDLRTTRDGPVAIDSFGHWAPSARWRLALTPAGAGEQV
jgi:cytochrome P450